MCKLQIGFVFYKHDRAATDGNSEFGHVCAFEVSWDYVNTLKLCYGLSKFEVACLALKG